MSSAAVHAIVRGRVQGVGFRMFVWREATRLGLSGYTRNVPDGSVEVLATGDDARLEQLLARLRDGPPGSRVDAVQVDRPARPPVFTEFDVRG